MRKTMLMAALIFCSGLHATDAPEPLTITTYDVYGSSADEINKDMDKNAPLIEQGRRFHAKTVWKIQTTYNWQTDGHHCVLEKFDATLQTEMILPHWVPPKRPTAQLMQQWERYSAALKKHEGGHYEVGQDAQQELLLRARSLGPTSDCQVLVRQINDLLAAVIDEHHRLDVEYDAKTNHGETQGARFP